MSTCYKTFDVSPRALVMGCSETGKSDEYSRQIMTDHSQFANDEVLHGYLHREPQVRLICSWCMKICLRRAAHISAEQLVSERLISVQTDDLTEIDMETNIDVDIRDKSVYTYVPSGHERSENQQVLEASNVTRGVTLVRR